MESLIISNIVYFWRSKVFQVNETPTRYMSYINNELGEKTLLIDCRKRWVLQSFICPSGSKKSLTKKRNPWYITDPTTSSSSIFFPILIICETLPGLYPQCWAGLSSPQWNLASFLSLKSAMSSTLVNCQFWGNFMSLKYEQAEHHLQWIILSINNFNIFWIRRMFFYASPICTHTMWCYNWTVMIMI